MMSGRLKSLLVAAFSFLIISFSNLLMAQEGHEHPHSDMPGEPAHETPQKEKFNASKVIFGHVLNGHEFHFFGASVPLPVLLYSPQRGFTGFMSSKFEHGHKAYNNYVLLTDHQIQEMGLDPKKYFPDQIIPVDEAGRLDTTVKVYDVSLTRNVGKEVPIRHWSKNSA
jgi:F-type H+-transporting ATPase subunit a